MWMHFNMIFLQNSICHTQISYQLHKIKKYGTRKGEI